VRRRVHDYIAAHLDQKIINDALAQIAGLSTAHFYFLARAEMSLAEIADTVGFSNQSHCIQSFRKIVGVTPGDYRRYCLQDSAGSLYRKRVCMARA
jgi:AraC-like DNA-binding protein